MTRFEVVFFGKSGGALVEQEIATDPSDTRSFDQRYLSNDVIALPRVFFTLIYSNRAS